MTFQGLGENIYETLGAYVLRNSKYIIFHQGAISGLLNFKGFMPGVPDLEIVKASANRGFFAYELGIATVIGHEVKLLSKEDILIGVGEAKGSIYDFTSGLNQLLHYLNSGIYSEGIS